MISSCMGIIRNFFATPVYIDKDIRCIEICRTWFDNARPWLKPSNPEVSEVPYRTTLELSEPGKSRLSWDPTTQPTWDMFNEVICEHVTYWLLENKYQYYKPRIVNCWLNEMPSGSQIQIHAHYGYSLSGIFYVNVPENAWILKFKKPVNSYGHRLTKIAEFTENNSDSWGFRIDTGNVVIFPSEMLHGVPTTKYEGLRLSVNFDVILEETNELPPIVEKSIIEQWGTGTL